MRLRATRLTAIAGAVRRAFPVFSPSDLFANNAPGLWYDLSLTDGTLFQDAAGTIPAAVEQPVGLMLDKSKGLALGPELVVNGDFSSGTNGWTGVNSGEPLVNQWGVVSGVLRGNRPTGAASISDVIPVANKTYRVQFQITSYARGGVYCQVQGANSPVFNAVGTYTCYVQTAGGTPNNIRFVGANLFEGDIDNISVRELSGNHAFQTTSASRPVLSARINQFVGTEALATQSLTTLATTYTLRFEGAGSITLSGTATGTYTAGVHSISCTAGTLTATVSGSVTKADLRPANDGVGLPPYQRVNTATDYDTVGFPLYLRFNGSTQFLQTNSIDFSSTDKVLVAAGVRKLSDSTAAVVAELSANSGVTPNTCAVFAPGAVAPNYAFRSSGTSDSVATATTFASPITNVLVGLGEVASDTAILRINGAQAASSTADQGTGNLGQHPLYIGARAGTSLFFGGRLYSLIIAGIKPTDAQILGVETYINRLTRAF